jgi:hypothetical protein
VFIRDDSRLFENYVGHHLHRNSGFVFRSVRALRARLRKTLGVIYGKPHSRNHFRRALRVSHRGHDPAGKILTPEKFYERPSMAGTRALRRRARPRH